MSIIISTNLKSGFRLVENYRQRLRPHQRSLGILVSLFQSFNSLCNSVSSFSLPTNITRPLYSEYFFTEIYFSFFDLYILMNLISQVYKSAILFFCRFPHFSSIKTISCIALSATFNGCPCSRFIIFPILCSIAHLDKPEFAHVIQYHHR